MPHCVSRAALVGVRALVARAPQERRHLHLRRNARRALLLAEVAVRREERVDVGLAELVDDGRDLIRLKQDAVLAQVVDVDDLHLVGEDRADNRHEFVLLALGLFHAEEATLCGRNAQSDLFHYNCSPFP